MKYHSIIIPYLVILCLLCIHALPNVFFSKNITIAHPETGLFLNYAGLYTPSEAIIHNSAIFPMTTATCHFLPLSAAESIPSCNMTGKRSKRGIPAVIALGFGVLTLAMSSSNSMQMESLEEQVALVRRTLSRFSQTMQIHGAYLAKIASRQIEFAEELQMTQKTLNAMMPILKSHAEAINTLKAGIEQLQIQFQHSFLYLAMTQIFSNKLTLDFFPPDDLHKVVYNVVQQGNLTFNSHQESLPIVQIITKLLVRQQIDFIPRAQYITDDPQEIGRLVITNFFAVPKRDQTPFYTYKLLSIPFFHDNETIQLAQTPRYWAINPANSNTIEWHDPEEAGCDFHLMISCRDTPPFRTISNDTCFDQIVGDAPLTKCRTTSVPSSKFFLRQLRDNLWVTSSREPLHCLKIRKTEYSGTIQHTWSMNEELILPPVAIVNVTPGYTIACPGFTLEGRPTAPNASSLVLFYNASMLTNNISVVDVHRFITLNTTWFNRTVVDREIKALMNLIHQTNMVSTIGTSLPMHTWSYGMLIFSWIFFGLSVSLIYYTFRRKRENSLQNF